MDIGRVQQNIAKLVRRAIVDESFRFLCLSDKAAAYKLVSDEEWPKELLIKFVDPKSLSRLSDNDEETVYVLPEFLPPTWLG